MEAEIVYCPNCHNRVLAAEKPTSDLPVQRVPGAGYYCPNCEMFVEAGPLPAGAPTKLGEIDRGGRLNDPGRARTTGSNAGGSQRGDLSDQGGTQWRRDPTEAERNTWKDK
jgi:hypothetical protein